MGSISAIHGITLSAWAFAGLTGNQLATFIVNHFGEVTQIDDGHGNMISVNPTGYQMVLYATLALYVVALLLSIFLVKKSPKAEAAAKASK